MVSSLDYQKVEDFEFDDNEQQDADDVEPQFAAEHRHGRGHVAWFRRPSVYWLLPIFLLFNLAWAAVAMPTMNVMKSLLCRKMLGPDGASSDTKVIIGDHNAQCVTDEVESATAMLNLYGNLTAAISGALVSTLWGKLSDRYGRIKPLIASTILMIVSEIAVILVAILPDALSVYWILLSFLVDGLSGSFIVAMALGTSYASDCTTDSERNVALGWMHGSMFFGMATGPLFGGYIGMSGGESRPMVIFYTALAMRLFALLYLCFVPESLVNLQERTLSLSSETKQYLRKASHLSWRETAKSVNVLQIFTSRWAVADVRRNLIVLASINTIVFGAFMGAYDVMLLYSEFVFGWANKESGIFLSIVNFFRTLATVVVLPLAMRYLRRFFYPGSSSSKNSTAGGFDRLDLFLIRIFISSDVIGYICYALAPTGALFTLAGVIGSFGAVSLAATTAAMTKQVEVAQTGELLGALGCLQAIARIVAPTLAGLTYSATVSKVPQLVFWGVAACFVAAGAASFWARPEGSSMRHEEGEEAVPLQDRFE